MAGEQAVLRALADIGAEPGALATVVHVDGSAYRREGAQMLIVPGPADAPHTVGLLSGGCLEDDVTAHARDLLRGGPPQLLRYDLRADGDDLWGLGLGCNGVVDVRVQSLRPGPLPYATAARWQLEGHDVLVATVMEAEGEGVPAPGAQIAIRADGEATGGLGDAHLDAVALAAVGEAVPSHDDWLELPGRGRARIFFDHCRAPASFVIFGAGADVPPVVAAAARVGLRVFVVDHRRALLTAERLPGAERLLPVRPEELEAGLSEVPMHAALIMTHNFGSDEHILRYLARRGPRYLGVLGPAARTERLLRRQELAPPPGLYGPVGLDLGAANPEEIALSIVAEVLAVLHGRQGGHLKDTPGPIHAAASALPR
jgi:xanthine dehydrogenase accessory factor